MSPRRALEREGVGLRQMGNGSAIPTSPHLSCPTEGNHPLLKSHLSHLTIHPLCSPSIPLSSQPPPSFIIITQKVPLSFLQPQTPSSNPSTTLQPEGFFSNAYLISLCCFKSYSGWPVVLRIQSCFHGRTLLPLQASLP